MTQVLAAASPRAARLRRGEATSQYDRQGYLIVRGLLDAVQLRAAQAEAAAICRGKRAASMASFRRRMTPTMRPSCAVTCASTSRTRSRR